MSGVYFNPGELEIMQGLSPAAFKAYVFLRSRMDWRTGLVGRVTKISHWAVGEHHEYSIPKGRGVQVVKLADTTAKIKDAARRLIEELERVGLLINQACAVLTFLCPMASIASARKNQTGRVLAAQLPTVRATPSHCANPSNDAGFDDVYWPEPGELATPEFDQDGPNWPYIVGLGSTPSQSSSTDCTGVDAAAGFDDARRGVNRDRATPSQAGSLGRPGNTGKGVYRDRPAASQAGQLEQAGVTPKGSYRDRPAGLHPAAGRRLAGVASLPAGTPDDLRDGETNEGSAEGDVAAAPESPESIRVQALHQVLRSELIIVPNPGPVVAEWVSVDVSDAELREAIRKARAQRAKDDSLQPIPLGYLSTIIKRERKAVLRAAERVQAVEVQQQAVREATPKELDVEAVARSLGMWPSRPGEDWAPFRARVLAAMTARQGAGDGQA
jgi:hypothetical protein